MSWCSRAFKSYAHIATGTSRRGGALSSALALLWIPAATARSISTSCTSLGSQTLPKVSGTVTSRCRGSLLPNVAHKAELCSSPLLAHAVYFQMFLLPIFLSGFYLPTRFIKHYLANRKGSEVGTIQI
ncbi:hypothetical protein FA13DRAFT_840958 [Coprinellus micaceus]|uniref:Uncharacterized protein n=1 Tax=Coprinellus micaceus TaxID=71717 RepID=A0A4Y7T1Q7_COPMI|nr:hypothetical protein FA13DRAFT_840958 [Coprinellus micaceus]